MSDEEINVNTQRPRRRTVLAYGEGEDEKIFLRYLANSYSRKDKITVQTGSAGGGDPLTILLKALSARRGEKRDVEFILLDTDKAWPEEMIELAKNEGIELIGNNPCLEAFLLDILQATKPLVNVGSGRYKELFEKLCINGNFDRDECERLFPKSLLKYARQRDSKLNKIIKIIEGDNP